MSGHIFCMHGIAPMIRPERFLSRNILEASRFETYLAHTDRFVSVAEAVAGRGNALTIDDATRAGADAALLARRHGHAVTLFVNPGQIESGEPYHFLLLNALLDQLKGSLVYFDGSLFAITTNQDRQVLRRVMKDRLRRLTSEEDRQVLVRQCGEEWNTGPLDVGSSFATLALDELRMLGAAGVDLQNHGWTHTFHAALTRDESAQEIRRGREWLSSKLNVDARWFAAPFGDSLPHDVAMACDAWFTFNSGWSEGWLAPAVYNRVDLPLAPTKDAGFGQVLRRLTTRVSGLLRHH